MTLKEKLPLVVGIGLPILLIIIVVIFAYLPSLFVQPKYNFVYATGNLYDYEIKVVNGKLNLNPQTRYRYGTQYEYPLREPSLFFYNVLEEKSTAITLSQAQTYNLDPSSKSPDGFAVGRADSDGVSFFPFFYGGRYASGQYLTGKGLSQKITDSYDFKFIGWVIGQ